jgi:hypothetical protein
MDILSEAIMEELLDAANATAEEREMVIQMVQETGNPWDVTPLLAVTRMALTSEAK